MPGGLGAECLAVPIRAGRLLLPAVLLGSRSGVAPAVAANVSAGFENFEAIALFRRLDPPTMESLNGPFSFDVPQDLKALKEQTQTFAEQAAAKVAGLTGLADVTQVFQDSGALLQKGLEVASASWTSFARLSRNFRDIYTAFKPLRPVFESSSGPSQIFSSAVLFSQLYTVVQKLLGTSTVLMALSFALHSISGVFQQLETVLRNCLAKLSGRRRLDEESRRLMSYPMLLDGLDFQGYQSTMRGYLDRCTDLSLQLEEVQAVLGPVLSALRAAPPAPSTAEVQMDTGRKLDAKANRGQYADALAKVVPAWRGIESLGISMCPQALRTRNMATSLKCRVGGFVAQGGILGMLGGIATPGGPCALPAAPSAGGVCPTKPLTANVKDYGGQSWQWLDLLAPGKWFLIAVAALGCLGGGAVGAMKMRSDMHSPSGHVTETDGEDQVELMQHQDSFESNE